MELHANSLNIEISTWVNPRSLDPLSCHRDYLLPLNLYQPQRLVSPVLGLSFANTRECGREEGLGLNDHLLLVHQAFIELPPCIKHSAWS